MKLMEHHPKHRMNMNEASPKLKQTKGMVKGTGNRFIDITGKRHGKLTVLGLDKTYTGKGTKWICQCDCGNVKSINKTGMHGKYGGTVSCGCHSIANLVKRSTTHGMGTPGKSPRLYSTWTSMKQRINDPNLPCYKHYGAKGIKMCERWYDFALFYEDIMTLLGPKPSPRYSIDRIDSNGDYEPSNVRWATPIQQGRNRSNNVRVTINGATRTLSEWAEVSGLRKSTIKYRYHSGKTGEDMIAPICS